MRATGKDFVTEYDMDKARLLKTLGWEPSVGAKVIADLVDNLPEGPFKGGPLYEGTVESAAGPGVLFGDWNVVGERGVQRFETHELYPAILREKTS